MSNIFNTPPQPPPRPAPSRRSKVLAPTLITLVVLLLLGSIFTNIWTERLWFSSVDYQGVFTKVLLSRIALFVVFALVTALLVSTTVYLAFRFKPDQFRLRRDDPAARYRFVLTPIVKPVTIAVGLAAGIMAGVLASSRWAVFQQWWHGTSFDKKDPHFGKDIGFYVFDLPWLQFCLTLVFGMLLLMTVLTLFTHYVFGGISFGGGRTPRFTRAAQIHLAVLGGLILLVRAAMHWLDRFAMALDTSGLFHGIGYTAANAQIPSRNIMIAVAIVCALLFFSAIFTNSWRLPAIGLAAYAISSLIIGTAWPALMQNFQVKPSEPDREGPFLERNIQATRDAYGLSDIETKPYSAKTSLTPKELSASAASHVSSRLIDPTLVSPAFEQLQQVRGYYSVPETLDVDRYRLKGSDQPQDVVIAAREVSLAGLQPSQRTWSNDHTVYTHGYGVIAAKGNERGPQGEPVWVAKDIPPVGEFEFKTPPRIYFGENSPLYSIVGRPDGAAPVEVDIPRGASQGDDDTENVSANTYDGEGGVPVGSLFNKLLYAVKFAEPNIVLSDRVNENSKILYDRHPRDRVAKVAPWLTLDGDTYPAVVDGRVVWIVDGYTTSNHYPYSEKRSLAEATDDTLRQGQAQVALPRDQINYMRNSVKAVVDAYDGSVKLYEWDTEDPVLKTWMKVFPDVVEPKSEVSEALLEHLRYPVDMFKVQRDVLSRYHVTNPQTFYEDGERWKVPEDPASRDGVKAKQPPYFLSMARPGEEDTIFSLTSVYLPNNRQNLAAFMSVNSEASDTENFGKIQILQLPSETQVGGPNQIAAKFQADRGVTQALLQYEQSQNARILRGNLLTLPVGDGLLYVQPIYIQRSQAEGSYPVLQFIIASFGDTVGIGQTLDEALDVALGLSEAPAGEDEEPAEEPPAETPDDGQKGPVEPADKSTRQYLEDASRLYNQADDALKKGDLATYQQRIDQMADALEKAQSSLE